jgi:hypothetical protein
MTQISRESHPVEDRRPSVCASPQQTKPRKNVMAAHQMSHERFAVLYKKLAE